MMLLRLAGRRPPSVPQEQTKGVTSALSPPHNPDGSLSARRDSGGARTPSRSSTRNREPRVMVSSPGIDPCRLPRRPSHPSEGTFLTLSGVSADGGLCPASPADREHTTPFCESVMSPSERMMPLFAAPRGRRLLQSPGEQARAMFRLSSQTASAEPVAVLSLADYLCEEFTCSEVGLAWPEEPLSAAESCLVREAELLENERSIVEMQVSLWCATQRQRVSESYLHAGNILCQLLAPGEYTVEAPVTGSLGVLAGTYKVTNVTCRGLPTWERCAQRNEDTRPAALQVAGDRRWTFLVDYGGEGYIPIVTTTGECHARLPHEVDDWRAPISVTSTPAPAVGATLADGSKAGRLLARWLRAEESAALLHERRWCTGIQDSVTEGSNQSAELLASIERLHAQICTPAQRRSSVADGAHPRLTDNTERQAKLWQQAVAEQRQLTQLGKMRVEIVRQQCREPWPGDAQALGSPLRDILRKQAACFQHVSCVERGLHELAVERWRIVRGRLEEIEAEQDPAAPCLPDGWVPLRSSSQLDTLHKHFLDLSTATSRAVAAAAVLVAAASSNRRRRSFGLYT